MLIADLELIDPGAGPARTNAQAKAGQLIIEEDCLRLAVGKSESGDGFLRQLHGREKTMGRPVRLRSPQDPTLG